MASIPPNTTPKQKAPAAAAAAPTAARGANMPVPLEGQSPPDRRERQYSSPGSITSSSGSTLANQSARSLSSSCILKHGRRYLTDSSVPYPFPCDVPELHRQNLWTTFLVEVYGAPLCSPWPPDRSPKKVLEIACGTGYWSSVCHDHFASRGYRNISFTGLDVVSMAPDLQEQGINWTFVQHDLRHRPMPFADDEFDLVFVKDLSFVAPAAAFQSGLMEEFLRVLKTGGVLEIWDSDHALRTLLPNPPLGPGVPIKDREHAQQLGIYPILPSTPGTPPQNSFLQDYNNWLKRAFDRLRLMSMPCTAIGPMMLQESEELERQGSRRFAILLSEVKWEREGVEGQSQDSGSGSSGARRQSSSRIEFAHNKSKSTKTEPRILTPEQTALRQIALNIFVQTVESLEPLLKDASGKNHDEWSRWWASMMENLLQKKGTSSGECLEVGAWWGTKA